jgi:hypothetical protein
LRTEGSCSLDVLYDGLEIIKQKFLIKKEKDLYLYFFLLQFLVIKTLDLDSEPDPDPFPDPDSLEMLDLDRINESVSTTSISL